MKKSFYVCDIETTGDNPMNVEMVEFYMAHYEGSSLKRELHLFIRPRIWGKAADESVEFHKITKEQAMKGLPWRNAMKEIWDFLPEDPAHFICHANRRMFGVSGCFDHSVLRSHFFDAGYEFYLHFMRIFPTYMIISTHSLAKEVLGLTLDDSIIGREMTAEEKKAKKKFDLKEAAKKVGITIDESKHHGAKYDGSITWKIFQKLKSKVNLDAFCLEDFYQLEKGIPSHDAKMKTMTTGFELFNTHTIHGDEDEKVS